MTDFRLAAPCPRLREPRAAVRRRPADSTAWCVRPKVNRWLPLGQAEVRRRRGLARLGSRLLRVRNAK